MAKKNFATRDTSRPYGHRPDIEALLDRVEVPHRDYAEWQTANSIIGWTRETTRKHACLYAGMRYRAAAQSAMAVEVAREMCAPRDVVGAAALGVLLHELEVPASEYGELAAERKLSAMQRDAHLSAICLYAGLRYHAIDEARTFINRVRHASAKTKAMKRRIVAEATARMPCRVTNA